MKDEVGFYWICCFGCFCRVDEDVTVLWHPRHIGGIDVLINNT